MFSFFANLSVDERKKLFHTISKIGLKWSWLFFTIFLIISLLYGWATPQEPPYLTGLVEIYKYFTLIYFGGEAGIQIAQEVKKIRSNRE